MGFVTEVVSGWVEDAAEHVGIDIGETSLSHAKKLAMGGDFGERVLKGSEEDIVEQVFGIDVDAELPPLPEIEPEYGSRMSPAVVRQEGIIELASEEELEKEEILGKTRKNLLSVPLTGGLDVGSTGAALTPGGETTGTGLGI